MRKLFYFDPRRIKNLKDIAHLSAGTPHHYSEINSDYERKICDYCLENESNFYRIYGEAPLFLNFLICKKCLDKVCKERRKMLYRGQINLSVGL